MATICKIGLKQSGLSEVLRPRQPFLLHRPPPGTGKIWEVSLPSRHSLALATRPLP